MTVRRGHLSDAEAACDVVRRSIRELCTADHRGDEATLEAWLANKTIAWFERLLTAEDRSCVVALQGERVCGFGLMDHSGEVGLLYVAPEARFQGASALLLDWMEDEAQRLGLPRVHLHSTKTALEFYRSRGYEPAGELTLGFGLVPCHPLAKTLPAGATPRGRP